MRGKPTWALTEFQSTNTRSCGGTLVTCQHVLTARHCVAISWARRYEESGAWGYNEEELLSPENIQVGLGSIVSYPGFKAIPRYYELWNKGLVKKDVQQIRAAESRYPGKIKNPPNGVCVIIIIYKYTVWRIF